MAFVVGPFHDLPLDVGSSEASAVTVYEDDYDVSDWCSIQCSLIVPSYSYKCM